MLIERFDSFAKKLNEYNYPSESTIIMKLKNNYDFQEQKNYKYSVKIGCPTWDIMKMKYKFYELLEDHRIFFLTLDGAVQAYYADPIDETTFGFIVDSVGMKYDFNDNYSYMELFRKFPLLNI